MSEAHLDPLLKEHTDPFDPYLNGGETAVRLFTENRGWYMGLCNRLGYEGDFFLLGMDPFIRFGHHRDHIDPENADEALFDRDDRPIRGSMRAGELPFRLKNAQHVIHEDDPERVLIVRFEGGAAILSRRDADVREAAEAIRFLESFGI